MAVFPPHLCLGVLLCFALPFGACRRRVNREKQFAAEEAFVRAIDEQAGPHDAGVWQRAVGDFDQAIALNPEEAKYFYYRGKAQDLQGNLDAAAADYTQALKLNKDWLEVYYWRGNVYYRQQKWAAALGDYRHSAAPNPKYLGLSFEHAYFWIIRARTGEKAAADQELAAYIEPYRPKYQTPAWELIVPDFLLGKITEQDFLVSANTLDLGQAGFLACQACYFVGVKRLLAGDKDGAAVAFRRSLTPDVFPESAFAIAELNALGQSPAAK